MSIFSLFSNSRGQTAASSPDFSAMSREELDSQFAPDQWKQLSYDERCDCIRELEGRFAQEQGRPAKDIEFVPMEGGRYGGWSKQDDRIYINDTLVRDDAFQVKGRLVSQEDANYQLYDTVAHEGYHAYQDYALENPGVHPDQQQLEEWRLNAESAYPQGRYESNYYSFDTDRDRYRLQPLERDAFEYGNSRTREAFDPIEAREGQLPGYDTYKDSCELDSYDNALNEAQQRDPETLSHMTEEMQDRSDAWRRGESRGEIGKDPGYYRQGQGESAAQDPAGPRETMDSLYGEEPGGLTPGEQEGLREDMGSLYGEGSGVSAAQDRTGAREDMGSLYGGTGGESTETGLAQTGYTQKNGFSR